VRIVDAKVGEAVVSAFRYGRFSSCKHWPLSDPFVRIVDAKVGEAVVSAFRYGRFSSCKR